MDRNAKMSGDWCTASIVRAIATEEDVDPLTLPPLYESVDPDALTRLVESAGASLRVQFHHCGYAITVDGDGTIELQPTPTATPRER